MTSEAAISLRGLTKRFGETAALEALDLDVARGTFLGVLGPAGSGKSTLLHVLAGLARPSVGSVALSGRALRFGDGAAARRRIGVVLQEPGLPGWMTARELLAFVADLSGIPREEIPARIDAVAARIAIVAALDRRVEGLPAQARGRLAMAQALVGEPELLLLDEPFHLLDPEGRLEVRRILAGLAGRATVLLATQRLADIEGLCDRVAVLVAGRLVTHGPVEAFLANHAPPVYVLDLAAPSGLAIDGLVARLAQEPWVHEAAVVGSTLRVAVTDGARASAELLPAVVATGVRIDGVRRERPSLDAVIAGLGGDERHHERNDERNGSAP